MSADSREPLCSQLRETIGSLATPDLEEIGHHKQFYPRDKLRDVLTRKQVEKLLSCACVRCRTDVARLKLVGDSFHDVDSIVGRIGSNQHPAETAISLFSLLLYIGHPQFIAAFLQQRINDHVFDTQTSDFSIEKLQRTFGAAYNKRHSEESLRIAKSFRKNMFEFAIPRMDSGSYTIYDGRTILPFVNEKPLGRHEDGEFIQEGAYGRVFSFEIWDEYRKFRHHHEVRKFARKELRGTPRLRFHIEKTNLDLVEKLHDPHIVKIIKAYRHGDVFNIIFPCAKTNLGLYLRDPESDAGRTFDELVEMNPLWQQMLGITHALCRITEYHTQDASQEPLFGYHFDLKPANILVEMSNNWVISDFGQATFREVNGTSSRVIGNAGTETYAPPEMADVDMKQSRKYDVWSLGCILLEVATFITQRHAGVQKLDEIRISKAEGSNSNGENDWYYHQDKGTQEYEVKPQISKWLKDLPKSEAIRTTNSTHFMKEIVSLAEKMLNVDVEKRITARDAYLTLRDILTRYRPRLINATDAETAIGEIDIDSNEIEVGKTELASIESMACRRTRDWYNASLQLFEDHQRHLHVVTRFSTTHQDSFTGPRSGMRLVPRYALRDDGHHGFSDCHIYFARMAPDHPNHAGNRKYHFGDQKGADYSTLLSETNPLTEAVEAVLFQSVFTGQAISRSVDIKKISGQTQKSSVRIEDGEGNRASTIQLWTETGYVKRKSVSDSASNETSSSQSSNGKKPVRAVRRSTLPEPTKRRLVIFLQKKIISIRLATNWRVEKETARKEDSLILRLVPTAPYTDPTFPVAVMAGIGDVPQENLPGIPLDQQLLSEEESKNAVECRSFEIRFGNNKDLTSVYQKYLSMKKDWKEEDEILKTRRKNMGTELGYTLE